MALDLEIALLSRKGGRARNEDACGHWTSDAGCCWVVSDGAGGHGGGDVAARTAVKTILSRFASAPEVSPGALTRLLTAANNAVVAEQQSSQALHDMRATGAVLLIDRQTGHALWGHLGDTRIYLLRQGRVHVQTRDHSVMQSMVEAGYGDVASLRRHPGRNMLLYALGSVEDFHPAVTASPLVLEAGDVFLLCSDGFWDYVEETDMLRTLQASPTAETWLGAMEAVLLERAIPGHDNYTAVGVRVGSSPEATRLL